MSALGLAGTLERNVILEPGGGYPWQARWIGAITTCISLSLWYWPLSSVVSGLVRCRGNIFRSMPGTFPKIKGIFSKLSIDRLIPVRWRLFQALDSDSITPENFPVFLKPEWGQNAQGIHRADNIVELQSLRAKLRNEPQRYILQEAAAGAREFEIFSINSNRRKKGAMHDVLTVTEALNHNEQFPINSKYNRNTRYVDISGNFSAANCQQLAGYLDQVGSFGISRMSVRADSQDHLLAGDFQVIEINLFLPMPINLLDSNYTWRRRLQFILHAMMCLARATKAIEPVAKPPAIFTRMMFYGRSSGRGGTGRGGASRSKQLQQRTRKLDTRRTIL